MQGRRDVVLNQTASSGRLYFWLFEDIGLEYLLQVTVVLEFRASNRDLHLVTENESGNLDYWSYLAPRLGTSSNWQMADEISDNCHNTCRKEREMNKHRIYCGIPVPPQVM